MTNILHRTISALILSFIMSGSMSCMISLNYVSSLEDGIFLIWMKAWLSAFILVFILAENVKKFTAFILKI